MSAGRGERYPELSRVSLVRSMEVDGRVLPPGSTGTIVHVYPEGRAYEVEFVTPFHALATVEPPAIEE